MEHHTTPHRIATVLLAALLFLTGCSSSDSSQYEEYPYDKPIPSTAVYVSQYTSLFRRIDVDQDSNEVYVAFTGTLGTPPPGDIPHKYRFKADGRIDPNDIEVHWYGDSDGKREISTEQGNALSARVIIKDPQNSSVVLFDHLESFVENK